MLSCCGFVYPELDGEGGCSKNEGGVRNIVNVYEKSLRHPPQASLFIQMNIRFSQQKEH